MFTQNVSFIKLNSFGESFFWRPITPNRFFGVFPHLPNICFKYLCLFGFLRSWCRYVQNLEIFGSIFTEKYFVHIFQLPHSALVEQWTYCSSYLRPHGAYKSGLYDSPLLTYLLSGNNVTKFDSALRMRQWLRWSWDPTGRVLEARRSSSGETGRPAGAILLEISLRGGGRGGGGGGHFRGCHSLNETQPTHQHLTSLQIFANT